MLATYIIKIIILLLLLYEAYFFKGLKMPSR